MLERPASRASSGAVCVCFAPSARAVGHVDLSRRSRGLPGFRWRHVPFLVALVGAESVACGPDYSRRTCSVYSRDSRRCLRYAFAVSYSMLASYTSPPASRYCVLLGTGNLVPRASNDSLSSASPSPTNLSYPGVPVYVAVCLGGVVSPFRCQAIHPYSPAVAENRIYPWWIRVRRDRGEYGSITCAYRHESTRRHIGAVITIRCHVVPYCIDI